MTGLLNNPVLSVARKWRTLHLNAAAEMVVVLSILALAGFLRINKYSVEPGWYNDEGTIINIATNLIQGKLGYLGINDSFLIASRQPLFVLILAFLFKLFGNGMTTLRIFTGILGVINTLLVYLAVRKENKSLAVIAGLWFAVLPDAVLYSRIGFSYNLEATFVLLAFWAALHYLEKGSRRFVFFCSLALGLAFLTELAALAFLPVLLIFVLWKKWKDIFLSLGVYISPFIAYSVVMFMMAPGAYLFDLDFIFCRVTSLAGYLRVILFARNMIELTASVLLYLGMAGIFFCSHPRLKKTLALFTIVALIVIGTSRGLSGLSRYQLIPLFPFISVGLGALTVKTAKVFQRFGRLVMASLMDRFRFFKKPQIGKALYALTNGFLILTFLLIPLAGYLINTSTDQFNGQYAEQLGDFLIDTDEGQAAVDYINQYAGTDDVILASPALAWAIKGNVTDYVIAMAHNGLETSFYPADFPKERMDFDPDISNVNYVIVDNIWLNWGEVFNPDLVHLRSLAIEGLVVFQTEHITIYKLKN